MKKIAASVALLGTLVLSGCTEETTIRKAIRLDHYIESHAIPELEFLPQIKVTFEYTPTGKVKTSRMLTYNPETDSFEEQRYSIFSYGDGKVLHIAVYSADDNTLNTEYTYEYSPSGHVSKMIETNHTVNITAVANITYANDGNVTVDYNFSNGSGFRYEFNHADGNILSDKTMRGAQLCNQGEYSYDDYKNPFHSLGYVDFALRNFSENNRVTEDVSYVGCSFPSLKPESYEYEYNDNGYPTVATTNYSPAGSGAQSRAEFFYTEVVE